jgi:hypothetical protein
MVTNDRGAVMSLADGLRDVARKAGIPEPEAVASEARMIYLNLAPDELAAKVAGILGNLDGSEGLFMYQDEIVTVEPEGGKLTVMKASAFRTWLPSARSVVPVKSWTKEGEPLKGGLTKDQAEVILNSDILKRQLPVISAVHHVRMPWLDDERDERGFRRLRLLKRGYDRATGIFTAGTLDFEEDMDFFEATSYFYDLFKTFAWRNEARDFAIHLAALVTMFGRGLYEAKAPMFVYNANIQESGKTTLASYVTWLIHGTMATKPLLQDQETKLQETLNSMALNGAAYAIFDNVNWGTKPVATVLLDQWISNPEWDFRRLNTNSMVAPKLRGMTLMTGNALKLSTDLDRRSLMLDLWNPVVGADRVLPQDATLIDGRFFSDVQNRKKGLKALWALIREWDTSGRPEKPGKLLGSFEGWAACVPSIVWHAGKQCGGHNWDCMTKSSNEDIGDKDAREYRALAEMALAEFGRAEDGVTMQATFEVTVQQFAGVARRNSVATFALWPESDVDAVLTTEGKKDGWKYEPPKTDEFPPPEDEVLRVRSASEWLTPKTRSSFGKALDTRLNDLFFSGPDGNLYHVKKRVRMSPARYAVTRVAR